MEFFDDEEDANGDKNRYSFATVANHRGKYIIKKGLKVEDLYEKSHWDKL